MKNLVPILITLLSFNSAIAQCLIEPWSLEKRVNKSELVIEGQVISKKAYWDNQGHNIYTINDIEVHKVFKGVVSSNVIQVVTLGGTVGFKSHEANPSLQFENNDVGIIILSPSSTSISNFTNLYRPTASVQSFIQYNLTSFEAHDYLKTYLSIKHELYEEIKSITKAEFSAKTTFDPEKNKRPVSALAPPVISSFSLDTLSSGTMTELTINGSNFGFAQGNGKVGFKDANFGDGRYYYVPYEWSYTSWSNTQIKVIVPSRAGTGKVEVVNNLNESGESSDDLYIKWAHLNVQFVPSGTDTQFYEVDHVNRNANGGYVWQYTSNFDGNADASASFVRAIEEWRCETGMNWDIGNVTTLDTTANDNVNIVRFTEFGTSTLGVCWSRSGGCASGGVFEWYVEELDIEFDSTYNWYYGTGTTPSGQFDFQTVALHELGHGHQLGHVRDNNKVMHYSIGTGTQKTELVPEDIEAGNYVTGNSVTANGCGPYGPMTAILPAVCEVSPPIAMFNIDDTLTCPLLDIEITDNSEGTVTSYVWDFGVDASPAAAVTEGPHTISYSSSGTKTVRLIVTNSFGSDTTEHTIEIKPDTMASPTFFTPIDSGCLGFADYVINIVDEAEGYQWSLSGGGTFVGSTNQTMVQVEWTSTGTYVISAVAANECTVSAPTKDTILIIALPDADYSHASTSTTTTFTSEASDAESHFWDFGDGMNSTEINPIHQFPDKGTYAVKYKVTNLCGADSTTSNVTVDFSAGVKEVNTNWEVYPNPIRANEYLTIKGDVFSEFEIVDVHGRIVHHGKSNNNKVKIPLIAEGSYSIIIRHDEKQVRIPIVVLN